MMKFLLMYIYLGNVIFISLSKVTTILSPLWKSKHGAIKITPVRNSVDSPLLSAWTPVGTVEWGKGWDSGIVQWSGQCMRQWDGKKVGKRVGRWVQ